MTVSGAVHSALPVPADVVAAVAGDPAAVRRVLAALHPVAVRYCRALLGPGGTADGAAREVVERVRDLLARGRDHRGSFLALVHRTARDVAEITGPTAAAGPTQPATAAGPTGVAGGTVSLVRALPADLRDVLALRVGAGLSVGDVAQLTGLSAGTVRVHQHRAIAVLRALAAGSAAAQA